MLILKLNEDIENREDFVLKNKNKLKKRLKIKRIKASLIELPKAKLKK